MSCETLSGELSVLLERLPVAAVIYGVQNRRIMHTNQLLDRLFAAKRGGLVGREASWLIPKLSERRRLEKCLFQNGPVQDCLVSSRREDGVPLKLSASLNRIPCDGHECVLGIFIDVSATAQQQTQLTEQLESTREMLELSERDRELISFEIHDGVVQDMTGALMHLEAGLTALERRKRNANELLDTARHMLRDGIKEARRLIDGVRPPDLDTIGLVGALQSLVRKFSTTMQQNIPLEFDLNRPKVPKHLETAVYRVVQECLNNVWRHSKSPHAEVRVVEENDEIVVDVLDWGVGFDPATVGKNRYGLQGLRARAKLFGGTAEITHTTDEGTGTHVQVRFPVGELEPNGDRMPQPTR